MGIIYKWECRNFEVFAGWNRPAGPPRGGALVVENHGLVVENYGSTEKNNDFQSLKICGVPGFC